MKNDLSAKQQQILQFIIDQQSRHGYPPSVREICEAANLSSTSTVHGHLERLERKGYIRRNPSKPRAIEIVRMPEEFQEPEYSFDDFSEIPEIETATIPVVGRVAAGEPILAVENIEDHFVLPLQAIGGSSEGVFILRIRGESMIKAGILDGDQVIVRKQNTARNGEIVIAMIDDSATCKRYFRENDFIRLQPENDTMNAFYVKDAAILGKVIGVYRRVY